MTDKELLAEAISEGIGGYIDLLDRNFPQQCNFIEDTAKLKALFCTRRAAKSYTGGLYLVKEAMELEACNCLYIGLTRQSAKGIIWKDVLKDIDTKNNLNMRFNGSDLTATLQNDSIIYVTGADADEDEMEKLLGKKYRLVVIDEAASFTVDLKRLIYGILKPATTDDRGTICLLGTSGNITRGLFFDVTNNKEPGWSLHSWSAHDNPYVRTQWQEELEDILINRPLFMQTPLFRQWYLNEWVVDEDKKVYKFSDSKNTYVTLPNYIRGDWSYVLGVDLGYEDASGFVVCAFHENDKNLYILESYKQSKMDITDVAFKIKEYQSRYPATFKVIIDGANKQAVEEIQKRHNIALSTADKIGKSYFIEIMNAEFIQGKVLLQKDMNRGLADEYFGLIWETEGDRIKQPRKEHPNCENHLTDAALYAWRYCYQFLSEAFKPKVDIKSKDQWLAHTEKLMEESLELQIMHEKAKESEQDMFNLMGMENQEDTMSYFLNKKRKN